MDDQTARDWRRVARTDEVAADAPKQVEVGELTLALYKIGEAFHATDDACTHLEASLSEGFVEGDVVECPAHFARFHIPTGRAVEVPAEKSLRTYPVKVVSGEIYVDVTEK